MMAKITPRKTEKNTGPLRPILSGELILHDMLDNAVSLILTPAQMMAVVTALGLRCEYTKDYSGYAFGFFNDDGAAASAATLVEAFKEAGLEDIPKELALISARPWDGEKPQRNSHRITH